MGYNITEATKKKNICANKNISCAKGKGIVNHSTVTRWLKKFFFGRKNLKNQARFDRRKTMNFKAVLQAILANLMSSTERVSGKLGISQYSVVPHSHDFRKKYLELHNCVSHDQNGAKF